MNPLIKMLLLLSLFLCCTWITIPADSKSTSEFPEKLQLSKFPLKSSLRYAWACREEICTKVDRVLGVSSPTEELLPLDLCKLNCGKAGALWPLPTGDVDISKGLFHFYPNNVEFGDFVAEEPVKTMLGKSAEIFKSYLPKMHPDSRDNDNFVFPVDPSNRNATLNKIQIEIAVALNDSVIRLGIDESYILALVTSEEENVVRVSISGRTYFGARHALETLSQLIAFNEDTGSLTIVQQAVITDRPVFTYRGILMDTARNFISIPALQRLIDGLSYNKLNFFHWHITDTQSFPFESKTRPIMAEYGAYSTRKTYTVEEMKELVEYARIRGVKVLPEFDAPAHVGNGWEWGPAAGLGELAVCINKGPWDQFCVQPPCGQLNPSNENMYMVLGELYKDFLDIFETDIFHMGGDEVKFDCWNLTDEITTMMTEKGRGLSKNDFIDVWGEFQDRAYDKLKEANQGKDLDAVLWTSELVSEEHVLQYVSNSTYIIQIWSNGHDEAQIIPFLIQNGYRTIFSQVDPWYFDCGYGAWVGFGANNWCSPYKGWQQVYMNSPIKILANSTSEEYAQEAYLKGLILGGEAAMWSEQVDDEAMESKIWPRGAALAERLWSDPQTGWYPAEARMVHHRERLVDRGLRADALQPRWCHQNEDGCFLAEPTNLPVPAPRPGAPSTK